MQQDYYHLVRRGKGFTLIELIVVIGIIGILAAASLFILDGSQSRARDARRESDLDTVSKAIDLYAAANNGSYPGDGFEWNGSSFILATNYSTNNNYTIRYYTPNGPDWSYSNTCIGQTSNCNPIPDDPSFKNALVPTYLSVLPTDPQNSNLTENTGYTDSLGDSDYLGGFSGSAPGASRYPAVILYGYFYSHGFTSTGQPTYILGTNLESRTVNINGCPLSVDYVYVQDYYPYTPEGTPYNNVNGINCTVDSVFRIPFANDTQNSWAGNYQIIR